MKILCLFCELWLVEPLMEDGEVSYHCLRCQAFPQDFDGEGLNVT
jgi:hypothetical protein